MLLTELEPSPPPPRPAEAGEAQTLDATGQPLPSTAAESTAEDPFAAADRAEYRRYPAIYSVKIALTVLAMALVWPGYRTFPCRVSPLALAVGVLGAPLWIGLCQLDWEPIVLGPLGLADFFREMGERPAFNPLVELADSPRWAYGFLAIRFVGLALVVPVIEEFFLRGFVMRIVVHDQWEQVPFGSTTPAALAVGTALPMLMHPAELFAAMAWFSLVTWLMVRTRNIWDCVAAHAITNLLLGIYVVSVNTPESWRLM
jgi:CAAX prenyl protease-like protein